MTVEPPMFRSFGHETVGVVHAEGTADERRFSVEAHVQPDSGFVLVDAPIYEGDFVEIKAPRGGIERKLVNEGATYGPKKPLFRGRPYAEPKWGGDPQARRARVRCLTIDNYPLLSWSRQESFHTPRWSGTTSERDGLLIYSCASARSWTSRSAISAKLSRQQQKGAIT